MEWRSDSGVIPVTDGRGKLLVGAGPVVLSFMFHPKSPRDAFVLAKTWINDLGLTGDGSLSSITKKLLTDATKKEKVRGGRMAGQILLHYFSLAAHYPKHKSINKAQHLVYYYFMRDNVKGPADERSLTRYWSNFKPVAHFWAAFVNNPNFVADDKSFKQFLMTAELYKLLAMQYGLDLGASAWRIPDDLAQEIKTASIGIPMLTSEGETALTEYKVKRQ